MELNEILHSGHNVQFYQLPIGIPSLPSGEVTWVSGDRCRVALSSRIASRDSLQLLHQYVTIGWGDLGVEHECPVIIEEVSDNSLELRTRLNERREYKRVATRLTLVYEEVAAEKLDAVCSQIMSETPGRDDLEIEVDRFWRGDELAERIDEQFAQMTRFLDQINAKLDYLIALGEKTQAASPFKPGVDLVSISGAGLSFLEAKPVEVNVFLKLRIQLSLFPLREIVCIGRVVRKNEQENGFFDIGVKFECIHEDDREKIFRFISRVERKMLRERKETASA